MSTVEETILSRYSVFLIDLWGVIWLGAECEPIAGASQFINLLQEREIEFYFLSNTVWPENDLVNKCREMGISADPNHFITSGRVVRETADSFIPNAENKIYYHVGRVWEKDAYFSKLNLTEDPHKADVLLIGDFGGTSGNQPEQELEVIDSILKQEKLITAIVCNPDRKNIQPSGEYRYQSGYYLQEFKQECPEHEYIFIGKPYHHIFEFAVNIASCSSRDKIAMIGDTIETDINGARQAGLGTILVTSGNTDVLPEGVSVDYILSSLMNETRAD